MRHRLRAIQVMLLVALAMVFIIPLIVYLLSEPCQQLEGHAKGLPSLVRNFEGRMKEGC